MAKKKKTELRLYITPGLDKLLKTLSGLSDQPVSSIVRTHSGRVCLTNIKN